jgi:hypothetical protein
MQQATQQFLVRACATVLFAACMAATAAVQAAPDEAVDARTAAARSLFTPAHAIDAPRQAARERQDGARHDTYLDGQRGGTDVHNTANIDGAVANNTATNVVTGNNTIDSGSFANMSGIPVVIQNSGANVLIQNATIINLQFK